MKTNAVAVLFAACGLLLMQSCRGPFEAHDGREAETGTLSLTVNSPIKGRTVMPSWPANAELRLSFLAQSSCNSDFAAYRDFVGGLSFELGAGSWNLSISALLPADGAGPRLEAARSAVYSFDMPASANLAVELLPISGEGGYGRFEWDVSFLPAGAASAQMEIRDWQTNAPLAPPRAYALVGGGSPLGTSGGIELPAGRYRVLFTMTDTHGETVAETVILHVYQNLASQFYGERAAFAFPASLLNFVLGAWNGHRWTFVEQGIHAGHFSALGLDGVADYSFGELVQGLDRLASYFGAPSCLPGLREFVDAVLAKINRTATITFDGNGHTGGTLPGPIEAAPGTSVHIPAPVGLTNGELFFVGWNTATDATGTAHFAGGSPLSLGDADVVLYAIWSEFGFDLAAGTITGFVGTDTELVIPPVINTVQVVGIRSGGWQHGLLMAGVFENRQLISVVIPDGVTSIGAAAFRDNQLTSVVIPDGVASIYFNAFRDNQLTDVVIPDGVTHIGAAAFAENQLTSVVIPDGVTYIGAAAFLENQLTSVVIPDGVTYIGYSAFLGNQLTSVVIPDGVTYIRMQTFLWNQLTSVVIPDGVTYIGEWAFAENQLTSVVIPDGVTYIGGSAFANNQLTSVVIPDSVTYIGEQAFLGNQLTSVVISDSVTTIRGGAFAFNHLTSITIPSGVDIAPPPGWALHIYTMGTHGDSFLAFYEANGRQAGTYTWNGMQWVLGNSGDAAFTLSFTGFTDPAAGIDADQSVSILASPAYVTVGGGFDQVRWIHNGETVPDASGASLDFSALHGNRIGIHHVTVEVGIGGRWYSRHIRISVTR